MTSRSTLTRFLAAALLAGTALFGSAAQAADLAAPKELPPEAKAPVLIDFAFGARIATDYNVRGISQSNHDPSPQAYGELQLFDNFLYFGTNYYRTDLPTKPQAEIDLTGGVRPKLGPLTFDFGYTYYYYPDERRLVNYFTTVPYALPDGTVFLAPPFFTPRNTDFLELAAKVSWAINDAWTVGSGVFYAWDWLGTGAPGTYVNGTAKWTIPENTFAGLPSGFAISGEIGHYSLGRVNPWLGGADLKDYLYWNAGISYTYKNLTLDLRYHDTDLNKTECFLNTTDPSGLSNGSGQVELVRHPVHRDALGGLHRKRARRVRADPVTRLRGCAGRVRASGRGCARCRQARA